ncbi:DUF6802 family protein [Corynebacterium ulceribovis]|uniref:DUF6802 family protein n=1 Tax=Corynebacterium ulceribovis TaxID=487732 RepID=UPI0003624A7A|nr:DUF6802 family protein [Corynebacterium ulceribovis]
MDDFLNKLCGIDALTPNKATEGSGRSGMTLTVGGETYVLGADPYLLGQDSVTLADDTGLTIYSDTDGDGAVDYLTTVRFDGSFGAWRQSGLGEQDVALDADQELCKQTWDGAAWEEVEAGKWVP